MENVRPLFPTDRLVKLRDAERMLAECFHPDSQPSRTTIIGWLEDGTLLGEQLGRGHNWYVWETSLQLFLSHRLSRSMQLAA